LTEAFGIGILEAACAGLFVVSTRVGGVPEVLPSNMIEFAEPEVEGTVHSSPYSLFLDRTEWADCTDCTDLVQAISRAIKHVKMGKHDPLLAYETLKDVYSWKDVAERTEVVYRNALKIKRVPVVERLRR